MTSFNTFEPGKPNDPHEFPDGAKKAYSKPRLIRYGPVQSMTTGGSPGAGDSGGGAEDPLGFRGRQR